jgi:hypothetical protein
VGKSRLDKVELVLATKYRSSVDKTVSFSDLVSVLDPRLF